MEKTPSFIVQAFGDYILLDRLAVGGMAEIYKAKQSGARGFEKLVVIKKILQQLREDPEFVEMFEDEAKIAAQLNQANIVQIYELGEVDDVLYIAMEYVEGKNLRDLTRAISNKGLHLSIGQCLYIITEILKGLDYAHRKTNSVGESLEIVHRDMSPQNVVISYEGEVKILDFGIAKAASRISRTEAGVLKGKFSYMSPEQASGSSIDQSTDIFAVGVILYELLTSERLFRAESDIQTLERVKAGFVPKPSEKNPLVPEALEKIVFRALARSPEDRYPTSAAFLSDVTQFAFEHKISMGSQELAAFMHSLFEKLIVDERERLNLALEQSNDPLLKASPPASTHIAFKAEALSKSRSANKSKSGFKQFDEVTMTTSIKSPRKKRYFLALAGVFVLSSLTYVIVSTLNSPPPAPQPPVVAEEERIEEESAKLDSDEMPDSEERETELSPDSEKETTSIDRIFSRPDAPEEEETLIVEIPEVVEEDAAPRQASFGTINLIAPPEGYAQVFISDRLVGSVPGPRARGIELSAGLHEFRCDTPNRSYRGKVMVNENRTRSIRCQDLNQENPI